jgi:outer membrane receptor protein involved in Fe transport
VFDLRGYWQVSTAIRITCGLENLTDQNYLEHLNVHVPQVYEPGRTVYLATQFEY